MIQWNRYPGGVRKALTFSYEYNYVMAQRNLRISADESMIYNPSNVAVWVERDKKDIFKIEPGQTLYL